MAELEKGHADRLLPIAPEFTVLPAETPEHLQTGRVFDLPRQRDRGGDIRAEWVGKRVPEIGENAGIKVRVDPTDGVIKHASAHDLRRAFGTRWAGKLMPADLKDLMRHSSIETTLRYHVGSNAEQTADFCWEQTPGADAAYAEAFFGPAGNGSGNTPCTVAAS